jgi:hypothetical protein
MKEVLELSKQIRQEFQRLLLFEFTQGKGINLQTVTWRVVLIVILAIKKIVQEITTYNFFSENRWQVERNEHITDANILHNLLSKRINYIRISIQSAV